MLVVLVAWALAVAGPLPPNVPGLAYRLTVLGEPNTSFSTSRAGWPVEMAVDVRYTVVPTLRLQ
jgi:hypothetical protein